MPRLPRRAPLKVATLPGIGFLRGVVDRSLIEQSLVERLAKAGLTAALLWLAIWWALS